MNEMNFLLIILTSLTALTLEQYTDDCSQSYGCFTHPSGCKNDQCQFIVKWADSATSVDFVLVTQIDQSVLAANSFIYTAVGFSTDAQMGQDSVSVCLSSKFTNESSVGSSDIQTYYNKGYRSSILDANAKNLGLSNIQVTYNSTFLVCSFTREKSIANNNNYSGKFYDLNNPYYLLASSGPANGLDEIRFHGKNKILSAKRIAFKVNASDVVDSNDGSLTAAETKLLRKRAHGSLMIIAWLLFTSTGILVSRHYKFLLNDQRVIGFHVWFVLHAPTMILATLVSITSFIIILAAMEWRWVSADEPLEFSHSIIGIVTIGLSIIQVLFGFLRPRLDHPKRFIFNHLHRFIGIFAFILSIVATFLGLNMTDMNLANTGWAVMLGWLIWFTILITLIEIYGFIIYFNEQQCLNSDKYNNVNTLRSIEMSIKLFEKLKVILLIMHLVISACFTIALILVIFYIDTA